MTLSDEEKFEMLLNELKEKVKDAPIDLLAIALNEIFPPNHLDELRKKLDELK